MESLLERQAVLAELGGLARGVRAGSGRVVLLRGEAGVGKTAVIGRFTAGLDRSVQVLVGWCDPLAAPRPLGPLLDALAGLSSAAAAGLGSAIDAGDTGALYRRLLAVLRDGQRWVWVIEDAHWADGATLDLLRFLARRIGSLPLLLVVTYRDDELHAQHPLAAALGDVASCAAVSRIGLAPLSRDAVAVLAAGRGVNADQLHRITGGNPFFVTEVLAAGPDALASNALPRSVSDAVGGRLARLSAPAREIAQAAAVCGPRAGAALMRRVCPGAVGGLTECLDAGVLVADGDVVGFRHELARRATLERIRDYQRRDLHARALAVLTESPIDPNMLAALAFHAEQAGDGEAVLRYGIAAAQRAAGLGAHRQAAELYALALRRADKTPAEQKVEWLEQHAMSSYLCGLGESSVSSSQQAIRLRHELGDPFAESDDLRWLSHELTTLGRAIKAADAARAALRLVQDGGPSPQLAWSLLNIAEIAVLDFDPATVTEYAGRATQSAPGLVMMPSSFGPAHARLWPECFALTPVGRSWKRRGSRRWRPTPAANMPANSGPTSAQPRRCTTTSIGQNDTSQTCLPTGETVTCPYSRHSPPALPRWCACIAAIGPGPARAPRMCSPAPGCPHSIEFCRGGHSL